MMHKPIWLIALSFTIQLATAQPGPLREEAEKLLTAGNYPEALQKAQAAVKADEGSAESWLVSGKVRMKMKDLNAAMADFEKAESLQPGIPDVLLRKGIIYYLTGKYKESVAELNKAEEAAPENFEIPYNRALAKIELDDLYGALDDLSTTIKRKPGFADAWLNRAMVNYDLEEFKACIKDCTQAVELNPNLADAYYYRALARGTDKKDKDAIDDFNKAIEIDPNHDEALSYRGSAKLLSGNKKGACLDWKKAMDLGNDSAENNYYNYCQ